MWGGGAEGSSGVRTEGPSGERTAGILGVILAGGRSRRFGGEKALFPLAGRPMAEWALRALEPNTARQVVVAHRPDVARVLGLARLEDPVPGLGPLGGLHAGLIRARLDGHAGVFMLACDLPLVSGALVGRILRAWPPDAPAAVPGSPGGPLGFEPLCAAYGVECLPEVEAAALSSDRSMVELVRRMGVLPIPATALGREGEMTLAFTNVNTRESARRAEEILVAGMAGGPVAERDPAQEGTGNGES